MLDKQLHIAKILEMRPAVLISGFLGAGKTTLLRRILQEVAARDIAADVILNDYANAEIDSETLRDHADSVKALAASCACCEGMDELCGMVIETVKTSHDLLLVELNGTADPLPILESFTLMENRFQLHPRWHLCVVDARSFGRRSHYNRLELLQLETASHYFISHSDEVDAERLEKVRQKVTKRNPAAAEIHFDSFIESLSEMAQRKKKVLSAAEETAEPSAAPALRPEHQLAHEFTACQFLLPEPLDASLLESWMQSLPANVMRAKALVTPTGPSEKRLLFERIGMQMPPKPYPVSIRNTVPSSAVLIGPDLNLEELLHSAQQQISPDCKLG